MKQFFSDWSRKWHDWWQAWQRWWQDTDTREPTIFHSARLKLTVFYLAVLLAFSLSLSFSIRALAEHEFMNEGVGERGIVRRLLFDQFSVPLQPNKFNQYQTNQDATVRQHLDEDVVLINLAALLLGGGLSYWYAGRTLRPIEEAHEAQARFASDASHELRTPLANLRVENEVFLRQKSFKASEARELIESNLEEVQRLESLAGNLLALTQYDHTPLRLGIVDIARIVDAATEQLQKTVGQRNATVERHIQPAMVVGHADSLTQLLAILLDNALKYGPDHGTVSIQGGRYGNRYVLSVQDEGQGITPQDLPHIFDRLYRGDKARTSKAGGYGLGLSLAREIATANHATIDATNHPAGGAVFIVSLAVS